jgi:hypothetical protein
MILAPRRRSAKSDEATKGRKANSDALERP